MSLNNQVSEQRKKKGLTQEELASLTKVTVRTIQRIESGESRPRSFTLKAISTALDIPFETFLEEKILPEPRAESRPNSAGELDAADHFLRLFCLSCFCYLVLPYVHFLIPARLLKGQSMLPSAVEKLARKIIRGQIQWTIGLHLFLLLTLAYNSLQARYGNRLYLLNYLWIVLGMYLLNAFIIGKGLRRASRLSGEKASITG